MDEYLFGVNALVGNYSYNVVAIMVWNVEAKLILFRDLFVKGHISGKTVYVDFFNNLFFGQVLNVCIVVGRINSFPVIKNLNIFKNCLLSNLLDLYTIFRLTFSDKVAETYA